MSESLKPEMSRNIKSASLSACMAPSAASSSTICCSSRLFMNTERMKPSYSFGACCILPENLSITSFRWSRSLWGMRAYTSFRSSRSSMGLPFTLSRSSSSRRRCSSSCWAWAMAAWLAANSSADTKYRSKQRSKVCASRREPVSSARSTAFTDSRSSKPVSASARRASSVSWMPTASPWARRKWTKPASFPTGVGFNAV